MKIEVIYNPRKPNGDVSDLACDACGNIAAAYVKLITGVFHRPYEAHSNLICKGCLNNWEALINKSILDDVMESVHKRKEKQNA